MTPLSIASKKVTCVPHVLTPLHDSCFHIAFHADCSECEFALPTIPRHTLPCVSGNDTLIGHDGSDTLYGGDGREELVGGGSISAAEGSINRAENSGATCSTESDEFIDSDVTVFY